MKFLGGVLDYVINFPIIHPTLKGLEAVLDNENFLNLLKDPVEILETASIMLIVKGVFESVKYVQDRRRYEDKHFYRKIKF
jgi:hypothetical protein